MGSLTELFTDKAGRVADLLMQAAEVYEGIVNEVSEIGNAYEVRKASETVITGLCVELNKWQAKAHQDTYKVAPFTDDVSGVHITNPLVSEDGRFRVSPNYYWLPEERRQTDAVYSQHISA